MKAYENFIQILQPVADIQSEVMQSLSPTSRPKSGEVLRVDALYGRLRRMIGEVVEDQGLDQERNRGAALHRLACSMLGFESYADIGQFPDILQQAMEVKLQTSSTVDLGLVSPDSLEPAQEVGAGLRHCDIRYAVAYAIRIGPSRLQITDVVVSTGEAFFTEFQRFEGLVKNTKLQVPLPGDFFRKPE